MDCETSLFKEVKPVANNNVRHTLLSFAFGAYEVMMMVMMRRLPYGQKTSRQRASK